MSMLEFKESKKYNIAWFKLAEFVARKEKERALAIYRLLSHSLNDEAFSNLLQADLLLSFRDNKAVEYYLKSAQLYEKSFKLEQAAAVYETLMILDKSLVPKYAHKLLQLYCDIKNSIKLRSMTNFLVDTFAQDNIVFWDIINSEITEISEISFYIIAKHFYKKNLNLDSVILQAQLAIDCIIKNKEESLPDFMLKLSSIDDNLYESAKQHLLLKWQRE